MRRCIAPVHRQSSHETLKSIIFVMRKAAPAFPNQVTKKRAIFLKASKIREKWGRPHGGESSAGKLFRLGRSAVHAHVGEATKIPITGHKKERSAGISLPRTGFVGKKKISKEPSFIENVGARGVQSRPPRTCLKNCWLFDGSKSPSEFFDDKKLERAARLLDKALTRERLVHANRTSRSGTTSGYLALNWQQAKINTRSSSIERRFARPDDVDSPLRRARVWWTERFARWKNPSNTGDARPLPKRRNRRRSGCTVTTNHLLLPSERRNAAVLLPITRPTCPLFDAPNQSKRIEVPCGGGGHATQSCIREHIRNLTENFIFKWANIKKRQGGGSDSSYSPFNS
jgi:hypothetical protein